MDSGIELKTPQEIELMRQGGKRLFRVKKELKKAVVEGISAYEIELLAQKLIKKEGGEPSFMKVPGYKWATCVNVNEGIVHGIPKKTIVFKKGDVVSVDVGMFFKGFHTDTSFSVALSPTKEIEIFLSVGKFGLKAAIDQVQAGNKVYDLSKAMEEALTKHNLTPVRALVGHGVGKNLHEEPQIPCFTSGKRQNSPDLVVGMVLAIEIMYTTGNGNLVLEDDGWTIATHDGTISALFEDTVAITKNGPIILTDD